MTPRLVAIDGPLKGSTFDIAGDSFSIGRKPENTLSPADLSISRQHCTIDRLAGKYRLTDFDSQNGTFVNGIPVRERLLCHGDQVSVGVSVFVFLAAETEPRSRTSLALEPAARPDEAPGLHHRMIGESLAIGHVLEFIAKVAALDSTVLITGERGSGKELAARTLHDNSPRASKPFVTLRCASLSETLLESEFCGHERTAFTGAVARKKGRLELAEGGTLFLDEVGQLPLPMQGTLLRLLQEGRFERLGGTRSLQADVRIIASTICDLTAAVEEGRFRQDLYFRLRVLSVEMPPLRQRRDDIGLLANYFRIEHSRRQNRRVLGITAAARECLLSYNWPGNVRELEIAIESAVAHGSTEGILPEDLPESILPNQAMPDEVMPRFYKNVLEAKRELVLKAFQQAQGDAVRAASILGLHPSSLQRLVRALDLQAALTSLGV